MRRMAAPSGCAPNCSCRRKARMPPPAHPERMPREASRPRNVRRVMMRSFAGQKLPAERRVRRPRLRMLYPARGNGKIRFCRKVIRSCRPPDSRRPGRPPRVRQPRGCTAKEYGREPVSGRLSGRTGGRGPERAELFRRGEIPAFHARRVSPGPDGRKRGFS